eukprot:7667593-Alexandrium_andersonii.AAC.1
MNKQAAEGMHPSFRGVFWGLLGGDPRLSLSRCASGALVVISDCAVGALRILGVTPWLRSGFCFAW